MDLIKLLGNNEEKLNDIVNEVLSIELNFNENHEKFMKNGRDSDRYPFYWRDIFEIGASIDKIFILVNNFYNKQINCDHKFKSNALFKLEEEILSNIKSFLTSYINNSNYVTELLKNNYSVIKKYSDLCNKSLNQKNHDFYEFERIFEYTHIFEKINYENLNIQSYMSKINIGTL